MQALDEANMAYWNELCGSNLAQVLGIEDASPASLEKFDDWYFDFYPYLFEHVSLSELAGKDVLEIGLGYGSLSQKLAEAGSCYTGLDIAAGPVEMVKHRLRQAGLNGNVKQGNILAAPFADCSFDHIVTIGCLHHTGAMAKSIEECRRLLRPGGKLTFMVYYAYSYRRWLQAWRPSLAYLGAELRGFRGVVTPEQETEKWSFDHNTKGELAPHIDFISVKSLRHFCRRFSKFSWRKRNIDQEAPFQKRTRKELLNSVWPSLCGLEIYASAIK